MPVQRDEPLLELETDKVTLEVNASTSGRLGEIRAAAGATVEVGAVLGVIAEGADGVAAGPAAAAPAAPAAPAAAGPGCQRAHRPRGRAAARPHRPCPRRQPHRPQPPRQPPSSGASVRKIVAESGIDITRRSRQRQGWPPDQGRCRGPGGDRARDAQGGGSAGAGRRRSRSTSGAP